MFAVHWAMTIRTDRHLPPTNRSFRRLRFGWYVYLPFLVSLIDAADKIFQKRKRDVPAVLDTDASESSPYFVYGSMLCTQTDGMA
jgi:hypothetical protein